MDHLICLRLCDVLGFFCARQSEEEINLVVNLFVNTYKVLVMFSVILQYEKDNFQKNCGAIFIQMQCTIN